MRNYAIVFLVLASLVISNPVSAENLAEANLTTSSMVIGTYGQFSVSTSGSSTSESLVSKLTISNVSSLSVVQKLEYVDANGKTYPIALQNKDTDLVGYLGFVEANMNFRIMFNVPGNYALGYSLENITVYPSLVLTSTAYPVTVQGEVLGTSTSKFIFNSNLSYGMRSEDVKQLQIRLTDEGLYSGPISGYFGPLTLNAVKHYQNLNQLPTTGFVGPLTRARLNQ